MEYNAPDVELKLPYSVSELDFLRWAYHEFVKKPHMDVAEQFFDATNLYAPITISKPERNKYAAHN